MKKAIALLLAAMLLMLCGCASQTTNEDEGTSGQPAVSSDLEPGQTEVPSSGDANGKSAAGQQGSGSASTLPQADSDGEAAAVPYPQKGNGSASGNSASGTTTTTKNNQQNQGTTEQETTGNSSSDGVTMPRVPIPQH